MARTIIANQTPGWEHMVPVLDGQLIHGAVAAKTGDDGWVDVDVPDGAPPVRTVRFRGCVVVVGVGLLR